MKVLIADKLSAEGIKVLEEAGIEVDNKPGMSPEELVAYVPGHEGIIVRSATTVTREVIEADPELKIVGRAGVGVDNIDIPAATEHGVIVCNAPTANSVSACEQTFSLMLSVARNTAKADESMQEGKWEKSKFSGHELYGKTLAIFGVGNIGKLIAKRAQAFDMKVIGYDPYVSKEKGAELGVEMMDDVDEICKVADFITVHLPKTKETIGMFSTPQFKEMKNTVYLINCARGGIYDEEALAEACKNGDVAGAALDVYSTEPCTDSPLRGLPNVVLTPHLGASTSEAQTRAATQIAEFVIAGLQGKEVKSQLNKPKA